MSRPIDADLLGLTDMEIIMCDGDYKEALKMLIDKIEHAPTIESEQRKGEWIDEGFHVDEQGPHVFRCSECGEHIIGYNVDSFCRWCGADMRGEL